jgi:hypothetical protein
VTFLRDLLFAGALVPFLFREFWKWLALLVYGPEPRCFDLCDTFAAGQT